MRKHWPVLAVFLAAAVCVYHGSFGAPFVFDDQRSIVENERIRTLWPVWEPLLGTSRPLVQLTLAANFAISGLNVWSYHLANLLIHVAAALTLYAALRLTLERYCTARLSRCAGWLAGVTALLWLVHPIQTESVTYVIQRGESMMGLFCLLTLFGFVASDRSTSARRWRIFSVVCCLLGLMTKPAMAVTPLLVLIYDRTFLSGSFGAALRPRRVYYAALFSTVAVLPVMLKGNSQDWATSAGFGAPGISTLGYAATQPEAILRYLRLCFWPDALCLDYGWLPETDARVITITSLLVIALVAVTFVATRRRHAAGFAGSWFFITLAPTSSFVQIADLIFEHRMYLPLAGLLALLVPATYATFERLTGSRPAAGQAMTAAFASIIVAAALCLVGRTILRNDDYTSEVALWTSAVEVSPQSARAQYNLGTALAREQHLARAVDHFRTATELRPTYHEAHYNLANALMRQGLLADAIQSYRRAITIRPDDWQMHNNLGVALLTSGDEPAAVAEFRRVLELNSNCASARSNLAKLHRVAAESGT
jgi:Flp pilus assembly protein TadD